MRDRRAADDNAYFFNWALDIGLEFQKPFEATHESMRALALHRDQPAHSLAFNLRRAFSGIVAGNVREAGIARVEKHGPFELRGDPKIIAALGNSAAGFRDANGACACRIRARTCRVIESSPDAASRHARHYRQTRSPQAQRL